MASRFLISPDRNSFTITGFWLSLIVVVSGYHRGICLLKFKGSHANQWGTVPVWVYKF